MSVSFSVPFETTRPDAPVFSYANANASVLLEGMGLPCHDELTGQTDARDFRRRAMRAIAAEAKAYEGVGATYFLRRWIALVELADYAEQHGLPVRWA